MGIEPEERINFGLQMTQIKSAEALKVNDNVIKRDENQRVGCSLFNEVLEFCLDGLNKPKIVKDGEPVYFSYDKTHDFFFKYPLVPVAGRDFIKLRVHGNFARHFQMRLFLKKSGTSKVYEIDPKYGLEPYR